MELIFKYVDLYEILSFDKRWQNSYNLEFSQKKEQIQKINIRNDQP